jgi:hypothetical protein
VACIGEHGARELELGLGQCIGPQAGKIRRLVFAGVEAVGIGVLQAGDDQSGACILDALLEPERREIAVLVERLDRRALFLAGKELVRLGGQEVAAVCSAGACSAAAAGSEAVPLEIAAGSLAGVAVAGAACGAACSAGAAAIGAVAIWLSFFAMPTSGMAMIRASAVLARMTRLYRGLCMDILPKEVWFHAGPRQSRPRSRHRRAGGVKSRWMPGKRRR